MKTEATQPQHTQGELTYQVRDAYGKGFIEIINSQKILFKIQYGGIASIKTKEEAEANAQRIVKAVNMHDELVNSLKAIALFVNAASKEYPTSAKATLSAIDNLLKQAEQK